MAAKVASTSLVCADGSCPARSSLQGRRVHRAVLADLQLGQVEPEGLGLPDQLLQLAVGLPVRPGLGQRALERAGGRR